MTIIRRTVVCNETNTLDLDSVFDKISLDFYGYSSQMVFCTQLFVVLYKYYKIQI